MGELLYMAAVLAGVLVVATAVSVGREIRERWVMSRRARAFRERLGVR